MAVVPIYCEDDSGGPLSKEEALRLLHLMEQRSLEKIGETQAISHKDPKATERERRSTFDYSTGEAQALWWAKDLLSRVVLDPSTSRQALNSSADELERAAGHLRRLAGDLSKF